MGSRYWASQIPPYAGVHAVHVRRGSPDIQYGYRVHATPYAVQEHCCDK